jgi:hypothetical protein
MRENVKEDGNSNKNVLDWKQFVDKQIIKQVKADGGFCALKTKDVRGEPVKQSRLNFKEFGPE